MTTSNPATPSDAFVWVWLPGAADPVVAGRPDRPRISDDLCLRAQLPAEPRRRPPVPARTAASARRDRAPLRGDRRLRGRLGARRLGAQGDRAPPHRRPLGPSCAGLPAGVGVGPHRRPRLPGVGCPLRGPVRGRCVAGRAGRGRGTGGERRAAHARTGPGAAARDFGGRGPAEGAARRRRPQRDRQVRLLDRPLSGGAGRVRRHGAGPTGRARRRAGRARPSARQGRAARGAVRPDRPAGEAHDGLGADHPGVARRRRHRGPVRHLCRSRPPSAVAFHCARCDSA